MEQGRRTCGDDLGKEEKKRGEWYLHLMVIGLAVHVYWKCGRDRGIDGTT